MKKKILSFLTLMFIFAFVFLLVGCDSENSSTSTQVSNSTTETQDDNSTTETHEHTWRTPTYTWSDDYSTCTAEIVCTTDATHKETETVDSTYEVVTPATCEVEGLGRYTATFTNSAFETQIYDVTIDALGHTWGTPTYSWSNDYSTCTAERVCTSDATHKEVETANSTYEILSEQTETTQKLVRYIVTFENTAFETQTVERCELPSILNFTLNSDNESYSVSVLSKDDCINVIIPDTYNDLPVTSVSDYAFEECTSLTSITIPDSVTSIGFEAFYGCYRLVEVINKSSLNITLGSSNNGYVAYYAKQVITDEKDSKLSKDENGFVTYNDGTDIWLISYEGSENNLTIPNNITKINQCVFFNCSSLTSITIPNSVTSIGSSAFYNCSSLNYNEYDNALYLGNDDNQYLFLIKAKSTDITSCNINENCRFIYSSAFYNCSSLTSITIPDSVTSIGDWAFSGFTSLTSITIPDSVTSMGERAFSGCTSLTSIIIPNSVTSIGEYAFYGCTSLTSITIPNSVTSIGSSAFHGCTSLTSITIPDSVTSIEWDAFYNCHIKEATIPVFASTYIKNSELEKVVITSGDSIPNSAFHSCTSLTSITIPDSVTSIGSSAFYGCTSLTSITIPDSVTSIGSSAFYGCYRLVEVINKSSLNITSGSINNGYVAYYAKKVITDEKDSKLSKDENGFVTYNDGTDIWLISYEGSENNLTIPNNITKINQYVFYNCSSPTSITIPDSVTSIGYEAFYNCSSLESITFNGTMEEWNNITKGSSWKLNVPATKVTCTDGEISL